MEAPIIEQMPVAAKPTSPIWRVRLPDVVGADVMVKAKSKSFTKQSQSVYKSLLNRFIISKFPE
jgi:reverse gyrase